MRDKVVDYVRYWADRTEVTRGQILRWIGLASSTFSKWTRCYGQAYEHGGWVPRDHWLEDWEKRSIIEFHFEHPLDGYRRLTYMMLDANVVAVSASSVYRVLSEAGLLRRHNTKPSKKGSGFHQPLRPHQHWHLDIAYLNIRGTFYFIASLLDGYSRSVVHWEIREKMEERDVETIVQRARELYPGETPRIITDNGPQFIAKDFKEFIRICGMTHVRTSPFYPQSNGKLERYHRTLKSESIRPKTPLNVEDAKRVVGAFVKEYNEVRLHSALGYITPADMLAGRQLQIFAERDAKLEQARQRRAEARQQQRANVGKNSAASYNAPARSEDRALLGNNPSAAPSPLASDGGQSHRTAAVMLTHTC